MKRFLSVLLLLCLLAALSGCGKKNKEESGVLRVGVLEPMSGKFAAEGLRETLGIQYANNEKQTFRINGKDYRVELVLKDNESDPARSAQCAQELVEEGCAVVLGSYGDELSAAASDVFLAAGVPAIAPYGADPALTEGNDHYFRVNALPPFQGSVLAAFARNTLGIKNVFCLTEAGNETDAALLDAFLSAAASLDLKVTAVQFPENTMDFTPWLDAAEEAGAGAVFAPCAIRYGQRLIEQNAAREEALPLLADRRWENDGILRALTDTDCAVYVAVDYAAGTATEFEEGFRAWLNENEEALMRNGGTDDVTAGSVLGYDAYFTALGAVSMAGSADKADILAILPEVSRDGCSGSYRFDADGGAVRGALWVEKADPAEESWKPVTAAKAP